MKTKILDKKYIFIELVNDNNFDVVFSSLGASIYSIKFDGKYMTQTPSFKDFYLTKNYHGKTIGRFANRFPGNVLTIDGAKYLLENNEGDNVLHGGTNGLSTKNFEYDIDCFDNGVYVTFHYLSKDGEAGFPGNVNLSVRYTVFNKKNIIDIDYEATTDKKTLWSLTNHAFYCMGEGSNQDLSLTINSDRFLNPEPASLLPLDIEKVKPCLNFSKSKQISKDFNDSYLQNSRTKGYDHYFLFKNVSIDIPQFILESSKYKLCVYTDMPGGQIYSDNWEDDYIFKNSNLRCHRGLAIEPGYCQKDLMFLNPNEMYHQKIILEFLKK